MKKALKTRVCITCKTEKPLTDYPTVKGGEYSKGTKCNDCSSLNKQKFHFASGKKIV